MIFVTVGISQPFDRLIKAIDKISRHIQQDFFSQIGRTRYEPINMPFKRFLCPQEFENAVEKADLVVTHGGFGSIFNVLARNKPLIAIPKTFDLDHTDNDQTDIVRLLESKERLVGVYDIADLERAIVNFNFVPQKYIEKSDISEDINMQIKKWFWCNRNEK